MDQKIKNYLGYTLIGFLVIFSLSTISYVKSYSRFIDPASIRSFLVSADADVVAIPDVAQFSFSVITEGSTDVSALQQENTKKVNDAIDFLKSAGVDEKDIKTTNYSVSPRYQYFRCPSPVPFGEVEPCPPAEIVGYTINQSVSVKIRDFEKSGDILTQVVKNGANSVSQLSFTIDDPTMLQDEAREKAIDKAKKKAGEIARAGGFRVGKLLSISESGGFPPVYRGLESRAFGMGGDVDDIALPSIEPGSQEVTVGVTLRYEIK